jgi:phosphodiesterase/alkaline phosphatase D-like protein
LGGSVYAFGAPVTLAEATTGTPATGVTSTSANLGGTVDPDGTTVTSCRFEYGLSTTYGSSATCAPNAPLTGNTTIPVATGLQGLQPNETYHYRLAATNAQGTGYGEDQTLTTSAASPTIGGQSVSGITQTTAILNAQIDPNNQATSYHFQYGTSSAYGSEAPIPDATIGSGYGNTNVGQPLTGLKPDTTYHYRVVASNASSPSGGTAGSDQTFTTPPVLPPVVTTGQAEGVAQNAATLTGTIDTQGFQTTYEFDLGTDTSYGTRIFGNAGTEPGPQAYIAALQGLMPGTTYHYRIVATSTFGTAYGPDQTFTTTSYSSATLIAPASVPLVPAPLLTITDTTTTSTKTITAKAAGVRHAAHPAKRNHTDKQTGKPRKRHRVRTQSINAKRVRNVNRGGSKR